VFLRDAAFVLALNTLVALALVSIIAAAAPTPPAGSLRHLFQVNLVFSQAIGLIIFCLVEWPRLTRWWRRPPGALEQALVTMAAVPVGYVLGTVASCLLLGLPLRPALHVDPGMAGIIVVTLLASFVAVHFITQRERLAAERLRAENADVRAASARLQLLQQQIEPHMLFNTIANAHALIEFEPDRAQRMLEALSALLHASMHMSQQPLVPLRQEFALLLHYLQLMAIRMGERLAYTLDLPPALAEVMIPPLSVQPLVENAVKHGLDPQARGGAIRVCARRVGERVLVDVVDDGGGLQGGDPFAGGRIGLDNVRKRLAAAFGDEAGLVLVDNVPRGVRATLTLLG
jgi:signal transduction histidine kinase